MAHGLRKQQNPRLPAGNFVRTSLKPPMSGRVGGCPVWRVQVHVELKQ